MPLIRACMCLIAFLAFAFPLHAQFRPRPRIPFATGTIGLGGASGSGLIQRSSVDFDFTGGVQFHNRRKYALVAGAFAGLTYTPTSNSLECPVAGTCPNYTPSVEFTGVMFGIESSPLQSATSMGVTLGPALLQTSRFLQTDDSGLPASRMGGLQIRLEGARRLRPTTRLIFSARNIFVPSYQGRRLSLSAVSIGFRIQRFAAFN